MALLNYTTEISANKTVGEITQMLTRAGARGIGYEFDEGGATSAVGFRIKTAYGERNFVLPVDSERVLAVLRSQYEQGQTVERKHCTPQHAQRVAWRIVKDWLAAQLALIETEMVSLDQVMLPFMKAPSGQIFYEAFKEHQLALPAGSQEAR